MKEFKRIGEDDTYYQIENLDPVSLLLSGGFLTDNNSEEFEFSTFIDKKDIPELIEYLQQFVEEDK